MNFGNMLGGGLGSTGRFGFRKKARGNNYRSWSSKGVSNKMMSKFSKRVRSRSKRGLSW